MTRDDLKATMAKVDDLYRRKDDAEYGSDEAEELSIQAFEEMAKVVSHVVLCLHDLTDEARRQTELLGRLVKLTEVRG